MSIYQLSLRSDFFYFLHLNFILFLHFFYKRSKAPVCFKGKDLCGPPGVDSKIEDSDIPILEDTSSSPTDCPQLCWLVATDIENIEK